VRIYYVFRVQDTQAVQGIKGRLGFGHQSGLLVGI